MVLLDSSAIHCFLRKQLAQAVSIHLDASARLDIRLTDGEQYTCLGVNLQCLHYVSAGVMQHWGFWVVPLAMDFILGLPKQH